jgi:hypothetical protein
MVACCLTCVGGTVGAGLLGQYGVGVFVALPVCCGVVGSVVAGQRVPRGFGGCVFVALSPMLLAGAILLAAGVEGLICIAMAFPLWLVLAMLGAAIGYRLQPARRRRGKRGFPVILPLLIVAAPLVMGAETWLKLEPQTVAVRTAVIIDAPPERVWPSVIRFPDLPPPADWLFRAGVAYPIRARIEGDGVGAIRYCEFSTGDFVEPIEVWDEPRLLRFSVVAGPPPMRELSPYDIHPPHLDGYFTSKQGQFLLTPLPGGRTRLEGTTWYANRMWPAWYWRLWSDHVIHRIHGRVLDHIKRLVEEPAAPAL